MRIALVYLGRRGAGAPISLELATNLARQAQVLAVISTRVEGLALWQKSGLELLYVATYGNLLRAVGSWINQSRLRRLSGRIGAWEPDILLFPMFFTWNPFVQWHLRSVPSLVAVHDPIPHPGLTGLAYSLLENYSIRQAARCLVFSQALIPDLERRGVSAERIKVLPLGELSYYRKHYPQPATPTTGRAPVLLFFGRISTYKGLEVLLQAYQELSSRRQARLRIVGAGDVRPYQSLLDRLPNVELINRWIDEAEIATIFQEASMLILPYTSGSQSGVLPIAASFALPVIATWVGGLPEQVEHGRTGLLVEPDAPRQLAQAIERLLDEPALARELGQNLNLEYQRNRNWARISEQVYALCQEILAE